MRRTETSALAFLDVMACGLGAVILILIVLKQQAPIETSISKTDQAISTIKMEAGLDNLQRELQILMAEHDLTNDELERQVQIATEIKEKIELTSTALAKANMDSNTLEQSINSATAALTKLNTAPPTNTVDTNSMTQQQYVVGLKVTGQKIIILLVITLVVLEEKM